MPAKDWTAQRSAFLENWALLLSGLAHLDPPFE
jgi:hypothetical protein